MLERFEFVETCDAFDDLDLLYVDQGKDAETKKMYWRTFDEKDKIWNLNHLFIFCAVNNLRLLNDSRG